MDNETIDEIDIITPIANMTTNKTMITNSTTSNINIQMDQFIVKFTVNEKFTEKLTDNSSSEYSLFVSRLDSFVIINFKIKINIILFFWKIKSGFSKSNKESLLIDWSLESLSEGSVVALTNLRVTDIQHENKDNFLRQIIEFGDKDLLPVKSVDIKTCKIWQIFNKFLKFNFVN